MTHRLLLGLALAATPAAAQSRDSTTTTPNCPDCATWNAPQAPFKVFGNTWFVGTHGLTALLITSTQGHVLIDGGLMESARPIAASIRALGFRLEDVKLLLNSHVHYDHAGGLGELQRLSGASVAATSSSAEVLRRGTVGKDDPQFGIAFPIDPLERVRVVADGDTVRVGTIALKMHRTAGHTPGGTSWSWTSCEGARCLSLVYGDSQSAVSTDGFLFSRNTAYPNVVRDFEASFRVLESLPCDILITPHPDASGLWKRVERRAAGEADALRDPGACKAYAASARERLARRLATERSASNR